MKLLSRGPLALGVLLAVLTVASAAFAEAARPVLTCGVEGASKGMRSADLCAALGQALKRTVSLVDDARSASGEAVQIIRGDVLWTVIWLSNGKVRAWTRVSQTEAADEQLRFVVHATEALAKAGESDIKQCVRLDPNGGHKMRASELSYPWAALKPCKRRSIEVVDPWWLPG